MFGRVTDAQLDPILKGVSRSIFLTLQVAPRGMRPSLGVGYLFCRAADTIADTRLLSPERRLECLSRFRAQFEATTPDFDAVRQLSEQVGSPQLIPEEHQLLLRLSECFQFYLHLTPPDRDRLRRLVTTLTTGMEMDLSYFPSEETGAIKALACDSDLDLYTYYVAGCVGEFWTELQVAHVGSLRHWNLEQRCDQGIRFGKALQMTNILRDLDKDLGLGRCYLPQSRLDSAGVTMEELGRGEGRERLRPLLDFYLRHTLDLYQTAWDYVLAIPRRSLQLRLACTWPLLIGLRTLDLLATHESPYAVGTHHKITRQETYSLIREATWRGLSNRGLDRLFRRLILPIETSLTAPIGS